LLTTDQRIAKNKNKKIKKKPLKKRKGAMSAMIYAHKDRTCRK